MATTRQQRTKKNPTHLRLVTDDAVAIDGFTWAEVATMLTDSVVPARCVYCQDEREIEADGTDYDCFECGGSGTVTSPLVKLGLI